LLMSTAISPASATSGPAVKRRPRSAVRWLSRKADRRLLPALAAFFAGNVSTCYISQTELWSGRAPDFAHWSPNLKRVIKAELLDTFARDRTRRIAVVERAGELVGMAVVVDLGRHYALLEDIVIGRENRGSGVGGTLVRWIFRQLREDGKTSVFLESGGRNTAAHRFFERQGFRRVSIAMCRRLAA
ncbi:MAG TPA: GNAT family N-acetyltransferase, partial [Opitutus sp.]|nr:GNAT family N-acetyltransferase [Opitutus sp.]